jgi:uncharacterized protein with GYD domain
MATFITTIKFTQQGIKDIDHSTKRAAIFKAEAKKLGAKVKDIYWTLGDHDGLLILEAPDDETATAAILHLGCDGQCPHVNLPGLHRRRDGKDREQGSRGMRQR